MSQSKESRTVLKNFAGRLQQKCESIGGSSYRSRIGQQALNVLEVSTGRDRFIVYALVSCKPEGQGFWGVADTRVALFQDVGLPWWVVLIHDSADNAYIFDAQEVEDQLTTGKWKQANSGSYKVDQRNLDENNRRHTFAGIMQEIGIG